MQRRQFLPTLAALAAAPLFSQARKDRQIILISIDGLPAYAFENASVSLPTIRRMASQGAIASSMRTVNPAVTWPNHTSMVTGVTPARHGVLFNGMPVRGAAGQPVRVEPWIAKDKMVLAPTEACRPARDHR